MAQEMFSELASGGSGSAGRGGASQREFGRFCDGSGGAVVRAVPVVRAAVERVGHGGDRCHVACADGGVGGGALGGGCGGGSAEVCRRGTGGCSGGSPG